MGELMVRREEQPWHARATVLLDDRARAHRGRGPSSSLETAVAAAASVVVHLTSRGWAVRLVTASGDALGGEDRRRDEQASAGALLEALAVVQASDVVGLGARWLAEGTQGGLVIAVLGSLEETDLPVVRRVRAGATTALALCVDVGLWGGDGQPGAAGVLAHQGWRVAGLAPTTGVDEAWRELGHVGRATPLVDVGAAVPGRPA
jgi:uncharacterized protein (DUF58 family)